jgi:hypothetical protein
MGDDNAPLTPLERALVRAISGAIVEDPRSELERPLGDVTESLVFIAAWTLRVVRIDREAA